MARGMAMYELAVVESELVSTSQCPGGLPIIVARPAYRVAPHRSGTAVTSPFTQTLGLKTRREFLELLSRREESVSPDTFP